MNYKCEYTYGVYGSVICGVYRKDHSPLMSHQFHYSDPKIEDDIVPAVPYSLSATSKVHIFMEMDKSHIVSPMELNTDGRKFIETIFSQASSAFKEGVLRAIKEESWK